MLLLPPLSERPPAVPLRAGPTPSRRPRLCARKWASALIAPCLLVCLSVCGIAGCRKHTSPADPAAAAPAATPAPGTSRVDAERPAPPPTPRGLILAHQGAAPGYVLYSPLSSGTTYLLDRDAQVVHTWQSEYAPHSLYLLDDGHLLRPGRDPDTKNFMAGGAMGLLQMFTWDGELVWQWKMSDEGRILHHDIEPLPNGHFLAIGWEAKTAAEARSAGRRPDLIPERGLWPDFLVEIEPQPPGGARIVWEWHVWDHLVQNLDPELPHYGNPAGHPGRIDINAGGPPLPIDAQQLEELKALGYVPQGAEQQELRSDFLHVNAVDWHPVLDQIAVVAPELGEIWILRRPRSSAEAASIVGDLLYRWGNPAMYGRGTAADQRLFYPHDVQWIPRGMARAGNLTIFNNGRDRPDGNYSSVEEITPPLQQGGSYSLSAGEPFGPAQTAWTYAAAERESFFAPFISGAHRLANGNTFVTVGPAGRLFEVTPAGETVWDFGNPFAANIRQRDGSPPWGGGAARAEQLRFAVWRAAKLPPDHPGLAGRELRPLVPQPAITATASGGSPGAAPAAAAP